MRRCSGRRIGIALFMMVVAASCGGTGGGPVDSGQSLVFQLRGRLNLIAQTTSDPRRLLLIATLLDPHFRDRQIAFTAEFPDVTMIPGDGSQGPLATTNGNRGTALTDTNGQARITLAAGRLTGPMRVTAEAPPELNLSTATGLTLSWVNKLGSEDSGAPPADSPGTSSRVVRTSFASIPGLSL